MCIIKNKYDNYLPSGAYQLGLGVSHPISVLIFRQNFQQFRGVSRVNKSFLFLGLTTHLSLVLIHSLGC